jgi:hypothetical protein
MMNVRPYVHLPGIIPPSLTFDKTNAGSRSITGGHVSGLTPDY